MPALAAAATLAIWSADPFVEWAYEGVVFLLAIWVVSRWVVKRWLISKKDPRLTPVLVTSALLAVWGFAQLALGATVYRYATLNASLRIAALAATALVASQVFSQATERHRLLRWFAGFGFVLGIASVVTYYTSPGKIFWFFPSPYPDVWGPFHSRNNFAQFLELAFPVSLWLGCTACRTACRTGLGTLYLGMSAAILACGLVSASRTGSVLLILEGIVVFGLARPPAPRRLIPLFALVAMALAAVSGGEVLLGRLQDSDPFRDRREIFSSSLAMIAMRPWTGYGLGNFATVYPEFATYDPGAAVEHAHNDWLEWATEGGWPYAAVWLLLAIATLRPALRSIWGIGVPAIFVHALVDYPFARLGVAAWLFMLAGALESKRRLQ